MLTVFISEMLVDPKFTQIRLKTGYSIKLLGVRYLQSMLMRFFTFQSILQPSSTASNPPKWMADLENDDINLLQGK